MFYNMAIATERDKGISKELATIERHLGDEGGHGPLIFNKTTDFCSKTIEMCDVIFSKQ